MRKSRGKLNVKKQCLPIWWQERAKQCQFGEEIDILLSRFGEDEWGALENLLTEYHVNFNRTKELIIFLSEIKLRDGSNIRQIIECAKQQVAEDQQRDQRFEGIRKEIKRTRYPQLSAKEQRWQEAVKKLGLPSSIKVHPPKDFEGESLSIEIRAKDEADYYNAVNSLKSISWAEIFSLI